MIFPFFVHFAKHEHDDERGQHHGKRSRKRTKNTHEFRGSLLRKHFVANVSGRVDADGTGRHLRDGHDVGKHGVGDPAVYAHHLVLNERQHGVSAANGEHADKKEGKEKLNENHFSASFLLLYQLTNAAMTMTQIRI